MANKNNDNTNKSQSVDPSTKKSSKVYPTIYFRAGGVQRNISTELALVYKKKNDRLIEAGLEPLIDRIEGLD